MLRLLSRIIATGSPTEPVSVHADETVRVGAHLREAVKTLYGGRALRIRHVDAGSTNGEEYEMTALGNAFYDIERFGLSFVASPRHADVLTVSGPVTRGMAHALTTAYELMPEPRIVIAVGDGAITGGIWKDSYAVVGAVSELLPVDAMIPGDPPAPQAILEGLLRALEGARQR
jgi:Ni,Fe-hydrogenase III small subunit